MISDETINEVRDRTDIVALVGRHVTLKKAGTLYKGLCPFHDEKTPSFTVSPTRNTYHCFGCQAHGDCFRFLTEVDRISFPEAVRLLAGEAGVTIPEERPISPEKRAARQEKKDTARRLLDLQDKLCAYYSAQLFGDRGRPAQRYLAERGIDRRAAEAFRLGYASGDKVPFQAWVDEHEIDRDDLVALGVLVRPDEGWSVGQRLWGGYLRFRERVMFPVVDVRGEVTGFSGRILDPHKKAAKYINSPETPVFTKGEQLYGAYTARTAARRAGRVVLVEGNVDVVMLWQAGIEGTVAPMGTALTDAQVRLVKRLAEHVICVMDGDAAGQKAAFGSLEPFLAEGIQPRAVMLPDGDDPDSFVRREGVDAFTAELDAAAPLLDLFIERAVDDHPADPQGRIDALRAIAPALARLDDPLAGALYKSRVASMLEVPEALVERALDEATDRAAAPTPKAAAPSPRGASPAPAAAPSFAAPYDAYGPPPPDDTFAPPPDDAFAPPPEVLDAAPYTGPYTPDEAPRPPTRTLRPLRVVGYVRDLYAYLVQYPAFVTELVDIDSAVRPGVDVHPGLTAFILHLHREVGRTATPNLDRLLAALDEQGHPDAVAFLRACQARRPDQTRETIDRAFRDALRRCERGALERRRRQAQAAFLELMRSDREQARALYAEVQVIKQRLAELEQPNAEGAH